MYNDERTSTALSLCGLVLLGTAAAVLVPGRLGAPNLLLGCALTLLLSVLSLRLIGGGEAMFGRTDHLDEFGTAGAAAITLWHTTINRRWAWSW